MRMMQMPTIDTPQPKKMSVSKTNDSMPTAASVTNRLVATGHGDEQSMSASSDWTATLSTRGVDAAASASAQTVGSSRVN